MSKQESFMKAVGKARAAQDKPKTITVRIAVAVTPDGDFYAIGWGHGQKPDGRREDYEDYEDMKEQAEGCAHDSFESAPMRLVWVTAQVPLPEESEVTGEVEG